MRVTPLLANSSELQKSITSNILVINIYNLWTEDLYISDNVMIKKAISEGNVSVGVIGNFQIPSHFS